MRPKIINSTLTGPIAGTDPPAAKSEKGDNINSAIIKSFLLLKVNSDPSRLIIKYVFRTDNLKLGCNLKLFSLFFPDKFIGLKNILTSFFIEIVNYFSLTSAIFAIFACLFRLNSIKKITI